MHAVRLDADMENRLNKIAHATHRSKTYYMKRALEDYLDANEEILLAIADYKERVRNGTAETISMEDLMKELGFERSDLVS